LKSIPHYEKKFWYIYKHQSGRCVIGSSENWILPMDALHHKLHNTKVNRKKYPLFIHSILNLVGVFNALHLVRGSWGRITDIEAQKYEDFLIRHPNICNFVNNPPEVVDYGNMQAM